MQQLPKAILHVENLLFLAVALYAYYVFGGNWFYFFLFFLVPDASMAGYLINPKIGAVIYNLVHNYFLAIFLLMFSAFTRVEMFALAAFILSAHVAVDRLCGFGLKYPDHFKHTHIQKL
jgi:GR25 family glycosyltransferase involved in LPS biosynthesis